MFESTQLQAIVTVFIFLVIFNFLPACVAYVDRHPERRLIAWLNLLSLFSFALWLALMAWAVGGKRPESLIGRWMGNARTRRYVVMGAAGVAAFSLGGTLGGLGVV
ncbi:hypothetical protein IP88_01060 [alpha proteobacterium AAP81b]|nr:hypothetical protein IP88_01060 [alpha proteobacterium AAP81b]